MQLAATCEAGFSPLCMQLYGNSQDPLPEAALWAVDHGAAGRRHQHGLSGRQGRQEEWWISLLLCEPDSTDSTSREDRRDRSRPRTGVPVTAKIRLGWDDDCIWSDPELARGLEDRSASPPSRFTAARRKMRLQGIEVRHRRHRRSQGCDAKSIPYRSSAMATSRPPGRCPVTMVEAHRLRCA